MALSSQVNEVPGAFLAAPFLAGVDPESRASLAKVLVEGRAPAGTAILTQGQPNDRLWFVLDGTIAIERTYADGRIGEISTLAGPAVFGTTTFFRLALPSATIRASSDLTLWTLDHPAHDRLRRQDPRAAEALALAVVRTLSERFDLLDRKVSELMAEHDDDHPRVTEWARFRARLFEEPSL